MNLVKGALIVVFILGLAILANAGLNSYAQKKGIGKNSVDCVVGLQNKKGLATKITDVSCSSDKTLICTPFFILGLNDLLGDPLNLKSDEGMVVVEVDGKIHESQKYKIREGSTASFALSFCTTSDDGIVKNIDSGFLDKGELQSIKVVW